MIGVRELPILKDFLRNLSLKSNFKRDTQHLSAMILFTIAKNNIYLDELFTRVFAPEAAKLLEKIENILSGSENNEPRYLYDMLLPISFPNRKWYSFTNDRNLWLNWIVMMDNYCECDWETALTKETLFAATLPCGSRCGQMQFYCIKCRFVRDNCRDCGSYYVFFKQKIST